MTIRTSNNLDMRYIYYEVHQLSDGKGFIDGTREIKNSNVLMMRPESLNSEGTWWFTNMTSRPNGNYLVVNQIWIDLDKYNYIDDVEGMYANDISKVIFDLKFKR